MNLIIKYHQLFILNILLIISPYQIEASMPATASAQNRGKIYFELPPAVMETNTVLQQTLDQTKQAVANVGTTLTQVQAAVNDLPKTINSTMINTINSTFNQIPSYRQVVPFLIFSGLGFYAATHGISMFRHGLSQWVDRDKIPKYNNLKTIRNNANKKKPPQIQAADTKSNLENDDLLANQWILEERKARLNRAKWHIGTGIAFIGVGTALVCCANPLATWLSKK